MKASNISLRRYSLNRFRKLWSLYPVRSDIHNLVEDKREQLRYDVVVVGGGPAGLATAIRLKQLALEKQNEITVCVLEKGSEIGSHILSGNVFEPRAFQELFPNWREMNDSPVHTQALEDRFLYLSSKSSYQIPKLFMPTPLHNNGNYVICLSQLVRWMKGKAEELGIDIFPGFPVSGMVYDDRGVCGVTTKETGVSKDGKRKGSFSPGVDVLSRQVILAEGAFGSCSEEVIRRFGLRSEAISPSFALGIKDVWMVPPHHPLFHPGLVQHTIGWPLQNGIFEEHSTYGGSFMYHMFPNQIHIGLVVGLDYRNPHLSPYQEFQRFKQHPDIQKYLSGSTHVAYGARVLNIGGIHSLPRLTVPGAMLVGCAAGFLNSVKIKGTHTAMKSGIVAAESLFPHLVRDNINSNTGHIQVRNYEEAIRSSWLWEELHLVRNSHAAFSYGLLGGVVHSALSCFLTKGREPWTLQKDKPDSEYTVPLGHRTAKPIEYPKHDGVVSFDIPTSLHLSGTDHEVDQPSHLQVDPGLTHVPINVSLKQYGGLEQRLCPAGVYEYFSLQGQEGDGSGEVADSPQQQRLLIHAQNCLHCKACAIKSTKEFVRWTVPEGGGGPNYSVM